MTDRKSLLEALGHQEGGTCSGCEDIIGTITPSGFIVQNHEDEDEPVRHRVRRYADSTWDKERH